LYIIYYIILYIILYYIIYYNLYIIYYILYIICLGLIKCGLLAELISFFFVQNFGLEFLGRGCRFFFLKFWAGRGVAWRQVQALEALAARCSDVVFDGYGAENWCVKFLDNGYMKWYNGYIYFMHHCLIPYAYLRLMNTTSSSARSICNVRLFASTPVLFAGFLKWGFPPKWDFPWFAITNHPAISSYWGTPHFFGKVLAGRSFPGTTPLVAVTSIGHVGANPATRRSKPETYRTGKLV